MADLNTLNLAAEVAMNKVAFITNRKSQSNDEEAIAIVLSHVNEHLRTALRCAKIGQLSISHIYITAAGHVAKGVQMQVSSRELGAHLRDLVGHMGAVNRAFRDFASAQSMPQYERKVV